MKKQALASNPLLWQIQRFIGEHPFGIVGALFVLLMWGYIQTETPINTKSTPLVKKELTPLKKEFAIKEEIKKNSEEPEELEEPEDPSLTEEKKEIRKTQAKATLMVYTKTTAGAEYEALEGLLNRYGLTPETIREFPEESLEELSEEDVVLLGKYQNLEVNLEWAREKINLYESTFIKRPREIRRERKIFLGRVQADHFLEMECALLEKISDPFISESFFEEVVVLLQMSGSHKAFDTLFFLFQNEKNRAKKTFLLKMLMNLDQQKALPTLFQSLENPSEIEVETIQELLFNMMAPGMEETLAPFLEKKNALVAETAQKALLRLSSPKATEILSSYEKGSLGKNNTPAVKEEIQAKLNNPDITPMEHREAVLTFGVLNPSAKFPEIEELLKKETQTEKRVNWYLLLVKIDKMKSLPYLIQSIDSKNDYETGIAKDILKKIATPGMESVFGSYIHKENSLIPPFMRILFLQMGTPEAQKLLKSMKYVEEEPQKEPEIPTEEPEE